MLEEPTQAQLDSEADAERGTAVDLPDPADNQSEPGTANRSLSVLALVTAAAAALVAVPASPAQAAPASRNTCDTQVQQVTVNGARKTRLWVTGRPAGAAGSYTFRLTWGWTNTVSTYRQVGQAFNAPRHTPLTKGESWVGQHKCADWFAGTIF